MTETVADADSLPTVPARVDSLPSVAVVIVHWMNVDDTVECLMSLSRVDYPHLAVVLVNNGSPDFDDVRLREVFPAVRIVTSNVNRGVTGGNNLGVARALEDGVDLILLLNPDTVVSPNLIRSLLPALDQPGIGIVGPVITYCDAPETVWFAGGTYSRIIVHTRQLEMNRPLKPAYPRRPVDFISSCALLAKREVFEKVGSFWEDLFMYFDEVDFCLRAARAGYQCLLVGEPLVRHKVSATGGVRGSNSLSHTKAYYFGRNPFLFLRRHATGLWAGIGASSQFVVVFPFWILRCILERNTGVLRDYVVGMRDGIVGRTGQRPS